MLKQQQDVIDNGKNGKQPDRTSEPMIDFKLDMGDATVELAWKTAQVLLHEFSHVPVWHNTIVGAECSRFLGNHEVLLIKSRILAWSISRGLFDLF